MSEVTNHTDPAFRPNGPPRLRRALSGAVLLALTSILALGSSALADGVLKPAGSTEFSQVEEREFVPVMEGIAVAPVAGDFSKGPHGTLIRLSPGARLPLHHYSAALTGVIIEGSVAHPTPGNAESYKALGPGDTFSFAAGEPHETNNLSESVPALFFIFQNAPWVFELDP